MAPRKIPGLLLLGLRPGLAGGILISLVVGGCALPGGQDVGQRTALGVGPARPITVDELDQITKSFADRYVLLLANACDQIRRGAVSSEVRQNAHRLKLTGATAAFDAATGPDRVKQLVDLAVGIGLQKIVWVDEGQAERLFGTGPAGLLSEALGTADRELWGLCTRAMRPEQIQALQETIRRWRRANPGLQWVSDIRFDVVAGSEGIGLIEGITGSLSPPSGSITDSIGQARLLGQRMFYYLKRLPRLMDWQTEAALENALSVPEASAVLGSVSRTLESVAGLVARVDEMLTASSGENSEGGEARLREVRQVLSEGKDLAREVRRAAEAFAGLRSAPRSGDRPSAPNGQEAGAGKPFDIDEYRAAAAQFARTIRDATDLLREVRTLTESDSSMRRVGAMVDAAMASAARHRRGATDHAAWRAAQLIVLAAVLLSLYTAILVRIRRKGHSGGAHPSP